MDENDTSWPDREPDRWHAVDLSRKQVRAVIDDIDTPPELLNVLDDVQASCQDGPAFLLIRVTDAS